MQLRLSPLKRDFFWWWGLPGSPNSTYLPIHAAVMRGLWVSWDNTSKRGHWDGSSLPASSEVLYDDLQAFPSRNYATLEFTESFLLCFLRLFLSITLKLPKSWTSISQLLEKLLFRFMKQLVQTDCVQPLSSLHPCLGMYKERKNRVQLVPLAVLGNPGTARVKPVCSRDQQR